MHALALFFSWPTGGVWSNLVASAIVGGLAWLWARRHVKALRSQVHELMDAHRHTAAQVHELHQTLHPPDDPENLLTK